MRFEFWLLLLVALIGAAYFGFESGTIQHIWDSDSSKLSFVIAALFSFSFLKLGYLTFRNPFIQQQHIDDGYEAADMSMAIGMLGTVIGFILMTQAFAGVDFSSVENVKELFKLSTSGMSTALYTTAAGLVSSITLRVMYYLTERD